MKYDCVGVKGMAGFPGSSGGGESGEAIWRDDLWVMFGVVMTYG